MLTWTPQVIRNTFYYQSPNVKYHLFTPSAINLLNCINIKQTAAHQNPLLISCHKIECQTGIRVVPFTEIPAKSFEISRMGFCAFVNLKRAFSKRRPTTNHGHWKLFMGNEPIYFFQKCKRHYCHGNYSAER